MVVVGGGIHGAGLARIASLRGFDVTLFEREDFGSGTSWASSKLIHGGLRYLEHGDVVLVRESLRERQLLFDRFFPNVHPLEFVIPVRTSFRRPFWQIRAGMMVYDLLSFDKSVPRHRVLPPGELAEKYPGMDVADLTGAVSYYDGQCTFPERLILSELCDAQRAGAGIFNYHAVEKLLIHRKRVVGVSVKDMRTGHEFEAPAEIVVNATGHWLDQILTGRIPTSLVRGTRGSHVVVRNEAGLTAALYVEARSDGRPFFILPWLEYLMIGTTDVVHEPLHAEPIPNSEEIDYLLDEFGQIFPGRRLSRTDIVWSFAGVRPLPADDQSPPGSISRRHKVVRHKRDHGIAGLFSLVGGKLTSYRGTALDVVKTVEKEIGRAEARVVEKDDPLKLPVSESDRHFQSMYGCDWPAIARKMALETQLSHRLGRDYWVQVDHAVRHEWAKCLTDIFFRRTSLGYSDDLGARHVDEVAAFVRPILGWSETEVEEQKKAYRRFVQTRLMAHLHQSTGQ